MIWQDAVLASVGFMFALFLLPMLLDSKPVNRTTAITTAGGLYLTAIVYSTLNLWLAVLSSLVAGSIWAMMLVKR